MIPKELIERINELARKSREEGLTECECAEQATLRRQYIAAFKERVMDVMDHTVVEEPDGTRHKLTEKD